MHPVDSTIHPFSLPDNHLQPSPFQNFPFPHAAFRNESNTSRNLSDRNIRAETISYYANQFVILKVKTILLTVFTQTTTRSTEHISLNQQEESYLQLFSEDFLIDYYWQAHEFKCEMIKKSCCRVIEQRIARGKERYLLSLAEMFLEKIREGKSFAVFLESLQCPSYLKSFLIDYLYRNLFSYNEIRKNKTIEFFNSLTTIDLNELTIHPQHFPAFFNQLQGCRSLKISFNTLMRKYESHGYAARDAKSLVAQPSSSQFFNPPALREDLFEMFFEILPCGLKEIKLEEADYHLSDDRLQRLAQRCPFLVVIHISDAARVSADGWKHLSSFSFLSNVSLINCKNINDAVLYQLCNQCRQLNTANITPYTTISRPALFNLMGLCLYNSIYFFLEYPQKRIPDTLIKEIQQGSAFLLYKKDRKTILHILAKYPHSPLIYDIFYGFIKANGQINEQDEMGNTALHLSILYDNLPLFNLLMQRSDLLIDPINREGETPLFLAMQASVEMVEQLVKCRANPNIPNHKGLTPLEKGMINFYYLTDRNGLSDFAKISQILNHEYEKCLKKIDRLFQGAFIPDLAFRFKPNSYSVWERIVLLGAKKGYGCNNLVQNGRALKLGESLKFLHDKQEAIASNELLQSVFQLSGRQFGNILNTLCQRAGSHFFQQHFEEVFKTLPLLILFVEESQFIALCEKLFQERQLDVNYIFPCGVSLLFFAKYFNRSTITRYLEEKRAQIQFGPITHSIMKRKLLANIFGLTGSFKYNSSSVALEGMWEFAVNPFMMSTVSHFFSKAEAQNLRQEVENILQKAYLEGDMTQLLKALEEEQFVFLISGFIGHYTPIFFYKDFIFIINRGAASEEMGTIFCKRFEHDWLSPQVLEFLKAMRFLNQEEYVASLKELIHALDLLDWKEKDSVIEEIIASTSFKKQKVPNCGIANFKPFIYFYALFLSFKSKKVQSFYKDPQLLAIKAKEVYKKFTFFMECHSISTLIDAQERQRIRNFPNKEEFKRNLKRYLEQPIERSKEDMDFVEVFLDNMLT
jgi:hypothetical protein